MAFRPDGIPCYVGKGKGGRYLQHLSKSHNRSLARIIIQAGGEIPIVKVRDGLTETEAFETEIALIAAIGRAKNGGTLVNATDGGEGVSGHTQSAEQIRKLRDTRIGRLLSESAKAKVSAALTGRVRTPEHCAAISAAKKGRRSGKPETEESRKKRSDKMKGRKRPDLSETNRAAHARMTDEAKAQKSARITAALTGKKFPVERRLAIGNVQRGKKKAPRTQSHKDALSRANMGRPLSPSHVQALKDAWVLRKQRDMLTAKARQSLAEAKEVLAT